MTIVLARRRDSRQAVYLDIADAIAREIQQGRLKPGERLPTQRDLAGQLGVTLTTVTRAYAEADRRGLVQGEVGRGTYVRSRDLAFESRNALDGTVNLGTNALLPFEHIDALADALAASVPRAAAAALFDYQPRAGTLRARSAGATWVARSGLDTAPEQIVITAGGQHGILISLLAATEPGDEVLVEAFAYSGILELCARLGRRVRPLAMDEDGIVPESLEAACREGKPRALYVMPTLHNPTTATMPPARREAIAALVQRHGLLVIEDDVYGYLAPEARPLASMLPADRTIYLTSLAKAIAPGVRIGYLRASGALRERLVTAGHSTVIDPAPVMAELAVQVITGGLADRIIDWKRRETAARQDLAVRILTPLRYQTSASSPHLWVHLPAGWSSDAFVSAARDAGVQVNGAGAFTADPGAGRNVAEAVRVCLGPPRTREALEAALNRLVEVAGRRRSFQPMVV
jgi:DNA-binding transcriptional MocR family regulator